MIQRMRLGGTLVHDIPPGNGKRCAMARPSMQEMCPNPANENKNLNELAPSFTEI
jgi:hypothetical protein